jgi:hypothetical protein
VLSPAGNFFVSHAAGAIFPSHVNSMGVDLTTVKLPPGVLRPGPVRLTAASRQDGVLLGDLVLSVPQPQPHIAVHTTTENPLAHTGQPITQDATVTNTGEVPLERVQVDLGPCRRPLGTLGPGRAATASCRRTAAANVTAHATGTSPAGEEVRTDATATIQIVHPALGLRAIAAPRIVSTGRPITYRARISNTGDIALTNVLLTASPPCSPMPAELAPGHSALLRCTAIASAGHTAATFTAVGTDPLGLRVIATARAASTLRSPAAPVPPPPPAEPPPPPAPRAPSHPKPPAPAPAHVTPAPAHVTPPPPPVDSAQVGPMSEPAATAAVIAVLGVFVMTVSVGAYAAAFRNK